MPRLAPPSPWMSFALAALACALALAGLRGSGAAAARLAEAELALDAARRDVACLYEQTGRLARRAAEAERRAAPRRVVRAGDVFYGSPAR